MGLSDGRFRRALEEDMPMTTDGFPVATTPAPGIAGVDWEVRVDFERLRTYRLNRTREALEASDLGALLLVRDEQHPLRHRHADRLLGVQQGGALRAPHADGASAHLRLRLGGEGASVAAAPPLRREELGRGQHRSPGCDPPARRPAEARRAGDPVDHDGGGRGGHAARRGRRRDVDLPGARGRRHHGPRRPAGDGRRPGDQEPGRDHAA